jgi:hypothetical protein
MVETVIDQCRVGGRAYPGALDVEGGGARRAVGHAKGHFAWRRDLIGVGSADSKTCQCSRR